MTATRKPRLAHSRPVNGAVSPAVDSLDVQTWTEPHAVGIHEWEEALLVGGAAWFVVCVIFRLVNDFLIGDPRDPARLAPALEVLLVFGVPVMGVTAWALVNRLRGGAIEIDPVARVFTWRGTRHPERVRASWQFGELVSAKQVTRWFSDAVRLDFGTRRFVVRVPTGTGSLLAWSLGPALAEDPDQSRGPSSASALPSSTTSIDSQHPQFAPDRSPDPAERTGRVIGEVLLGLWVAIWSFNRWSVQVDRLKFRWAIITALSIFFVLSVSDGDVLGFGAPPAVLAVLAAGALWLAISRGATGDDPWWKPPPPGQRWRPPWW